jgi:carbohydrate diacid regulator
MAKFEPTNRMRTMQLTDEVAQRIVDWVAFSFDVGVSVADTSARIIASTDPDWIGIAHPLAIRAIAHSESVEDGDVSFGGISIPIVSSNVIIGAIVLNDMSHRARKIANVSKALAELIIHQMSAINHFLQQRWARDTFVYDLLHGSLGSASDVGLQEAALLGIDLSIPRVVVLIDIKQVTDQLTNRSSANDLFPSITQILRIEHSHTDLIEQARRVVASNEHDIYSFIGDRWLALLAVLDRTLVGGSHRLLDRDVQRFLDELAHASGITTSAGIGHYYPGWSALARSFADARFALETGTRLHGPGRVFLIEELGLASFICNDNRLTKDELSDRLISPIRSEPELLATLDAFLHAHLSPSLAAQTLHIHRHTLAYRLDKITRLTGRNPRRFEDAVQLYAALLLWKMNSISS